MSDIALQQALPDELAESAAALVGCIARAMSIENYGVSVGPLFEVGIQDGLVLSFGHRWTRHCGGQLIQCRE